MRKKVSKKETALKSSKSSSKRKKDADKRKIISAINKEVREGNTIRAATKNHGITEWNYYAWKRSLAKKKVEKDTAKLESQK